MFACATAKRGEAYTYALPVPNYNYEAHFQSDITLSSDDVQLSRDLGEFATPTNIPTELYPFGILHGVLTASEMDAGIVILRILDASGMARFGDAALVIHTYTNDIDDVSTLTAAQVNAACDAALDDYDPPTATEITNAFAALTIPSAADIATAVWAAGTRTLTSLGTLLSALPAAVWAAATRTLTTTAAQTAQAVLGDDLTLIAAADFDATLTGLTIPVTWTKIWLTAKSSAAREDSAALLQLVETNPASAADGLLYLNSVAGTAAQGTLTVNQSAGTIAIHIDDDATVEFSKALGGGYDVKCLDAAGASTVLTSGAFSVELTETRSIA